MRKEEVSRNIVPRAMGCASIRCAPPFVVHKGAFAYLLLLAVLATAEFRGRRSGAGAIVENTFLPHSLLISHLSFHILDIRCAHLWDTDDVANNCNCTTMIWSILHNRSSLIINELKKHQCIIDWFILIISFKTRNWVECYSLVELTVKCHRGTISAPSVWGTNGQRRLCETSLEVQTHDDHRSF